VNFKKYVDRVNRLHLLIKRKATGPPDAFANKVNMSRAALMRHLAEMKKMGAPIEYNPDRCSYQYTGEVEFLFGLENLMIKSKKR